MSGYSETSRQAYARADITAGQRRILDWFERNPNAQATRQELVQHCRAPINVITARVFELIELGVLESLPAVDGRHPLRLKRARAAPVDASSEEFRHACEVRYVANMESDSDRRRFLQGVFEKRGRDAWKRLRGDVWAAMKRVAA
jgi:hypothetical protein